jgi:hypothetical protein
VRRWIGIGMNSGMRIREGVATSMVMLVIVISKLQQ